MAENVLARILEGITKLKRGELDAVRDAVKERRNVLKRNIAPPRGLTEEEKNALTGGNIQRRLFARMRRCMTTALLRKCTFLMRKNGSKPLNPLQEKEIASKWPPIISGGSGMR